MCRSEALEHTQQQSSPFPTKNYHLHQAFSTIPHRTFNSFVSELLRKRCQCMSERTGAIEVSSPMMLRNTLVIRKWRGTNQQLAVSRTKLAILSFAQSSFSSVAGEACCKGGLECLNPRSCLTSWVNDATSAPCSRSNLHQRTVHDAPEMFCINGNKAERTPKQWMYLKYYQWRDFHHNSHHNISFVSKHNYVNRIDDKIFE